MLWLLIKGASRSLFDGWKKCFISRVVLDSTRRQFLWVILSSPSEKEKRDKRDSKGDERQDEWQWKRRNKNIPLYPYLLQE